jgi:Aminoglycoside adenylyltransferase, C-terminal domain
LVWDDHCNTAVVRWSLRERGIALAGPAPNEIVDPVDPDVLRAEARLTMREFAAWADQTRVYNRWTQSYVVLSLCRMLNTIDTGKVVSKREAGEWALEAGDPMWQSLIQAALDDRPDPWVRVTQPSSAEAVAETMAFVEAALRLL